MVIFDTSGSMLDGTNDGSPLCSNNGTAARIHNLKQAMREALAQVGTDEANFGLMRFPQIEAPSATPVCPTGHYTNDPCCTTETGCTSLVACGTDGGRRGCKLTTHNRTTGIQTTYGSWFDSGYRQAVLVDVTQRPNPGPVAQAGDHDPPDGNIRAVYDWIDLAEDTDNTPPTVEPELRSGSGWYTPLGRSIFYSRMYLDNYVYPNDPKKACRSNVVILVTDGLETCDNTRGTTINLNTCATTGTWGTFQGEVQACQLFRNSLVKAKTYVVADSTVCTAGTADPHDLIALAGGTGTAPDNGICVSLTDAAAVKTALVGIIAETVKPAETCNGLDDNCNGQTDEGVSNACAFETCPTAPTTGCTNLRHCAVEACNCLDDDCDGLTDEGLPVNACGQPCGCAIPNELCNGLDDDCDADIDEGFNVGQPCDNGGIGACRKFGLRTCRPDGMGTLCDAPPGGGTPEICNNIDDDCDGLTDEKPPPLPGEGEPCGIDIGQCKRGTTICRNGRMECDQTTNPGVEICNGLDDNCNGIIDDGMFPQEGMDCLCPGLSAGQAGVGQCRSGKLRCRGAMGFRCEGCVLPTPERCNGLDDDCDGIVDVPAPCPNGFGCQNGECVIVCRPGEFPCPAGMMCVAGYCVKTPCAGVTCPDGTVCRNGMCVDLCSGVTCPPGSSCRNGTCFDPCDNRCLSRETCVDGTCIPMPDPCEGVTCPVGQYCDNGACVNTCGRVNCPSGQSCVAGQCRPDPCANRPPCNEFDFCDPTDGECKPDPCPVTQCAPREVCVPVTGTCIPDPCLNIRCDSCHECKVTTDGTGHCAAVVGDVRCVSRSVGTRGGGAFSCHAAGGPVGQTAPTWLALVIGLAAAAAWRRSRRR